MIALIWLTFTLLYLNLIFLFPVWLLVTYILDVIISLFILGYVAFCSKINSKYTSDQATYIRMGGLTAMLLIYGMGSMGLWIMMLFDADLRDLLFTFRT